MRKKKLANDHEDMDLPAPERGPEPVAIDDGILRLLMFILIVLIVLVLAYGLWRQELLSLWRQILGAFS
jgi:hypothetical protein